MQTIFEPADTQQQSSTSLTPPSSAPEPRSGDGGAVFQQVQNKVSTKSILSTLPKLLHGDPLYTVALLAYVKLGFLKNLLDRQRSRQECDAIERKTEHGGSDGTKRWDGSLDDFYEWEKLLANAFRFELCRTYTRYFRKNFPKVTPQMESLVWKEISDFVYKNVEKVVPVDDDDEQSYQQKMEEIFTVFKLSPQFDEQRQQNTKDGNTTQTNSSE